MNVSVITASFCRISYIKGLYVIKYNNGFLFYDSIVTYSTNREWNITERYVNSTMNWQILITTRETCCQTILFRRFSKHYKILKKSCWTVMQPSSEIKRPSADCQTTFLTYKPKFREKSVNGHSIVVWRSRDRRLTVKQFFSAFQQKWQHFEKSRCMVMRQSEVTRP